MQSPSRTDDIFPDRLTARDWIESSTGVRAKIVVTSKREHEFNEPMYRLRYESGIKSRGMWSRDDFVKMGCRYLGELVK